MDTSDALRTLTADPARTGIFLDFDGTLSAIVPQPQDARLVDGAKDALEALAERFGLVAIVSGRTLEDLRTRVGARGVLYAGAYGRERSDSTVRRQTEGWETVAFAAGAAIRSLPGVVMERKGAGIALHYRAVPEMAEDVKAVAQLLADEFSLQIRPGRKVFELVVPGPGKGEAISALIEQRGFDRVFVAGDDWGDLEAFEAVAALGVQSVIVAVSTEESPPDLSSHADVIVASPDELVAFLKRLAAA